MEDGKAIDVAPTISKAVTTRAVPEKERVRRCLFQVGGVSISRADAESDPCAWNQQGILRRGGRESGTERKDNDEDARVHDGGSPDCVTIETYAPQLTSAGLAIMFR
jgi:hypothetical protein